MHPYYHEYRYRRICEVEDTRVRYKHRRCLDCRDNEDGVAREKLERDGSGELMERRHGVDGYAGYGAWVV